MFTTPLACVTVSVVCRASDADAVAAHYLAAWHSCPEVLAPEVSLPTVSYSGPFSDGDVAYFSEDDGELCPDCDGLEALCNSCGGRTLTTSKRG